MDFKIINKKNKKIIVKYNGMNLNFSIKKYLLNKYFLISIAFFIWMLFFDSYSIISHYKIKKNIKEMEILKHKLKRKIYIEKIKLNYND